MSVFVCSKLTCDNAYTMWTPIKKGANDLPKKTAVVMIKGGSGVANKHFITPRGVVTEISNDQIKMLRENNPVFCRHEKRGYLVVLEKKPSDPDKVAKDLNSDKSQPITPETLQKQGKKPGKVNKKS